MIISFSMFVSAMTFAIGTSKSSCCVACTMNSPISMIMTIRIENSINTKCILLAPTEILCGVLRFSFANFSPISSLHFSENSFLSECVYCFCFSLSLSLVLSSTNSTFIEAHFSFRRCWLPLRFGFACTRRQFELFTALFRTFRSLALAHNFYFSPVPSLNFRRTQIADVIGEKE